jgi:tetratricopeptide (TPR) repeat protein
MKKALLLLTILPVYGISQLSPADDSLKKVLYRLPDDTAKVNSLNRFAEKIQFAEPVEAIDIIQYAAAVSDQINYPLGASTAYGMRAMLLFYEMKLDSAKSIADKAYRLVSNNKDIQYRNQLAALTNIYGSIYQQQQLYDSAVEKYQESARIYSETKNESKIIFSFYNLSVMYGFLEEPEKSLFYAREVQKIANRTNDSIFILRSFIALSDTFLNLKKYDSVLLFSQKGLGMARHQNITFAIGKFHALLGTYYGEFVNKADSAITHFNIALEYFIMINL